MSMFTKISSIPMSARWSFIFLSMGYLEKDGHAVVLRQGSELIHVPVGQTCCLMLGPGVVVTQEAIKTCAQEKTLLVWVGEEGVRCHSAGQPGGASAEAILRQASKFNDPKERLLVARKLYRHMFGEEPPQCRGIAELRGYEGNRVKAFYKESAEKYRVTWQKRDYDVKDFGASDDINKALSVANAALYGVTEAVILALGYAPAIGFIHSGDERSFVFDLADTVKMEVAVDTAFKVAARHPKDIEMEVRKACRDKFREVELARRLVTILEDVME